MKVTVNRKKFTVYRLISENHLYVAIPKEYEEVIAKAVMEFHDLASVPSDKTVRGIFLREGETLRDENAPQNDITINQLREE